MIRGDINGASPRRGGARIFYEGEIHHMQTASARDERFRPIALGAEIFYACSAPTWSSAAPSPATATA